jgi:hypothetical protein
MPTERPVLNLDSTVDLSWARATASRRRFLQTAGTALGWAAAGTWPTLAPGRSAAANAPPARPKVAAVFTDFQHRFHAHVILENFLVPYLFNGQKTDPGVDVVSFYADQFHEHDMARDVSRQFGIPLYRSIPEALCRGGKELAVDAVLCIGEHGDYPLSPLGQIEYPRKRFFDECVAVMKRSNRFVPLFNDKHLSYRWDWAREMYDTARALGIPLMAGSSVPLAQRRPALELPSGAAIEAAVSIHGGPLESYDFHGFEVLQSLVEARRGGETGVASLQFLDANRLREAARKGRFSQPLAEDALAAALGRRQPLFDPIPGEDAAPHGVLLEYKDGLKGLLLRIGNSATRWSFACRIQGEPASRATSFYVGPWNNRNLFKALSHAIQDHFLRRRAPYPVERTLLTTGLVAATMESHHAGGKRIATPHLEFAYAPRDFRAMREMGASWKIITESMPEPTGIAPVGIAS